MNILRTQKLTKDLIAIDSVTGNESEIASFLKDELRHRGMTVQTFQVAAERMNIFASWHDEPAKILFNTHLDTVPEQYGPFEDDKRIYGRGACDTHGILAAQLEALQDLHAEGIAGLGILLVVGEEKHHDGALHAAKCDDILEPQVLIVGEPTENKLMESQKGRLKGNLSVYGVEGHSGYPEKFDSAVEKLFLVLDALWQSSWLKNESVQGTTMNATMLQGGDIDNQIPAMAKTRLMFRCVEPCSVVKKRVSHCLNSLEKTLPEFRGGKSHFELYWDPAQNDPIANLSTLPGFATGAAAFNTDIAYFGWKECKTFLVGPGSILQAHKDLKDNDWGNAEWIYKKDQIAGVRLYKKMIYTVLPSLKS